jgi:ankyrin repeat protein
MQILIDARADLDEQDSVGGTALNLATWRGSFSTMELLLESKARVDVKDSKRMTALMAAAKSRNLEILGLLLRRGARTDLADHSRCTALLWASFAGCAKAASRLLEQRANMFARNILGLSALHIAVAKGAGPVVGLLLSYSTGRFLGLKDHSRLIALHYAAKFGEEDIFRLLISWRGIESNKIFVDEGDYEAKTALHHAALSGKPNARCEVQFYALAYALASALANAVTVDLLDKRINYSCKTDPYRSLRGNRNPRAELYSVYSYAHIP